MLYLLFCQIFAAMFFSWHLILQNPSYPIYMKCLTSQEAFTRVLMGNIEISRTIFPSGTRGENEKYSCLSRVFTTRRPSFLTFNPNHILRHFWADTVMYLQQDVWFRLSVWGFLLSLGANMEMLGRRALWEVGLNYGHGTGHGVGNYFGVHECMMSSSIDSSHYTWAEKHFNV